MKVLEKYLLYSSEKLKYLDRLVSARRRRRIFLSGWTAWVLYMISDKISNMREINVENGLNWFDSRFLYDMTGGLNLLFYGGNSDFIPTLLLSISLPLLAISIYYENWLDINGFMDFYIDNEVMYIKMGLICLLGVLPSYFGFTWMIFNINTFIGVIFVITSLYVLFLQVQWEKTQESKAQKNN
jgi:hypothetical protein